MFLYLSDVNEHAGPFMYMRHTTWGLKWGNNFRQRPPKGYYPGDDRVEQMIPEKEKMVCTGKVGTIIFCDTTGIHRGGYSTGNQRIMFTAGYVTDASASPALFRCDAAFRKNNMFSQTARHALAEHHTPFATYIYHRYKQMFRQKKSGDTMFAPHM